VSATPDFPSKQRHSAAIKFVVDSNVWIQSVVSKKQAEKTNCQRALHLAHEEGMIIGNQRTFDDLKNALYKLLRRGDISAKNAASITTAYKRSATLFRDINNYEEYKKIYKDILSKCEDKDDWAFLALAHEQNASYIITNDRKHLSNTREYMGAKIVTPEAFVKEMAIQRIKLR
jgi:predicted nucleic acid-binding protein